MEPRGGEHPDKLTTRNDILNAHKNGAIFVEAADGRGRWAIFLNGISALCKKEEFVPLIGTHLFIIGRIDDNILYGDKDQQPIPLQLEVARNPAPRRKPIQWDKVIKEELIQQVIKLISGDGVWTLSDIRNELRSLNLGTSLGDFCGVYNQGTSYKRLDNLLKKTALSVAKSGSFGLRWIKGQGYYVGGPGMVTPSKDKRQIPKTGDHTLYIYTFPPYIAPGFLSENSVWVKLGETDSDPYERIKAQDGTSNPQRPIVLKKLIVPASLTDKEVRRYLLEKCGWFEVSTDAKREWISHSSLKDVDDVLTSFKKAVNELLKLFNDQ